VQTDNHNSNDPFNVEYLREMLKVQQWPDLVVYYRPEQPKPFMTHEECEQCSRGVSAADIIFAHGLGVDLTR
jgi:hypothetical protein